MGLNIFKSRRAKLKAMIGFILEEKKLTQTEIDYLMLAIDDYEKDNLNTIEKLKKEKFYETKRISGALKQTINAHGPITALLIGSATKRI
jgi:hypothetical protein